MDSKFYKAFQTLFDPHFYPSIEDWEALGFDIYQMRGRGVPDITLYREECQDIILSNFKDLSERVESLERKIKELENK